MQFFIFAEYFIFQQFIKVNFNFETPYFVKTGEIVSCHRSTRKMGENTEKPESPCQKGRNNTSI